MTINVIPYVLGGAELSREGNEYRATVGYRITGLTGGRRVRLAMALAAPGLPVPGDQYPGLTSVGLVCLGLTATPFDSGIVDVVVRYGIGAARAGTTKEAPAENDAVIEVGSASGEIETNKDLAGDPITVSYTPSGGQKITQGGLIRVRRAELSIRFSRTETRAPADKSRSYTGTVNSDNVGAFRPGQLFCDRLAGQSSDGGVSYRVDYSFLFSSSGHKPTAVYIDPVTSKPPVDLEDGIGIVDVDVYRAESYSALKLPWPR